MMKFYWVEYFFDEMGFIFFGKKKEEIFLDFFKRQGLFRSLVYCSISPWVLRFMEKQFHDALEGEEKGGKIPLN